MLNPRTLPLQGLRMGKKRAGAWSSALFFSLIALLLSACAAEAPAPERLLYTFKGSTMGTYYVVKLVRPAQDPLDDSVQERLLADMEAALERVNGLMSTYLDESELSRFNRAPAGEPFPLSAETFEVFEAALEIARLTDGALDITLGPLIAAWGFGAHQDPDVLGGGEPLSGDRLAGLMAAIGVRHLTLDPAAQTVTKHLDGLNCDLSSLAKGYAVDQVLEALSERGHTNIMVEVGGEVRTAGTNFAGVPWRLGIEQPAASLGRVQRIVGLQNQALATSGDYRNYREVNGIRVSHILDPVDGKPIDHRLASVSVVDDNCMMADALSTALMVMGPEKGMDLADRENLAALFLVRDGESYRELPSRAFREGFMGESQGSSNAASIQ